MSEAEKINNLYRKSIFEKDEKFKFLLFEERDDRHPRLCESVQSSNIYDMGNTIIQVNFFNDSKGLTEQDYIAQRDRLEREGWTFHGEAFDELPIGAGH